MSPRRSFAPALSLIVLLAFSVSCFPQSEASEPAPPLTWQLVGIGDCTGQDVAMTDGSTPDNSKATPGHTAICWDGVTYINKGDPGKAFCAYKKVSYDSCKGGSNPGEMFKPVAP
jgi:hypothetical protein